MVALHHKMGFQRDSKKPSLNKLGFCIWLPDLGSNQGPAD